MSGRGIGERIGKARSLGLVVVAYTVAVMVGRAVAEAVGFLLAATTGPTGPAESDGDRPR